MTPEQARKMRLTTDYPLDKVVFPSPAYPGTGSVTVSGYNYADVYIPHGLTYAPLPVLEWTTDPTWSIKYEGGNGPVGLDSFLYDTAMDTMGPSFTPSTSVIRVTFNNNTPSPVTFYYRVYAFAPSNKTAELVRFTNDNSQTYLLNTDYNYTKLFQKGIVDCPLVVGGTNITTVTHNFGLYPQIMAWQEDTVFGMYGISHVSGREIEDSLSPAFSLGPNKSWIEVRTDNIRFYNRNIAARYHYRIYVDQQ